MAPTVLLVATATKWLGAARIPRDLDKAGWSVALLGPKGSLAEHSRFVRRIGHLPDAATPLQWGYAFAAAVRATTPRLVLPCDDTAFRLMQLMVTVPPDGMPPELGFQLAALVTASLGDPAYYRISVDKKLICPAAEAAGVRVPPYRVVAFPSEAESFVATHGWPIVLKRTHSSAGAGVAICADADAFKREFARLVNEETLDLNDSDSSRLLVQAYIPGHTRYFAGTAWRGSLICGYAVDKLEGEPQGPASVVRYFHSPELQDSAAALARALGMSGIFAAEYIVHAQTGALYLIEINRRITPGTHRGEFIEVSTGAALLAAVEGKPLLTRTRLDDGEEHIFVNFPHEWLRDPASRYLCDYPVDVPWDEPALIEAMLAMRHEA